MSFVEVLPVEPVIADEASGAALADSARRSPPSPRTRRRARASAAPRCARVADELAPPRIATKRSPGPTRRESISRPVSSPEPSSSPERAPELVDRERDHAPAARRSASRATTRSSNGQLLAGDLLALLVALAGDHDNVPGLGQPDRARDRRAPVGIDLDVHPGALEDVLDDRERLLAARVVGRDIDDVGEIGGDLAHQRPLAAVAVAAGAEDARARGRRSSSRAVRSTLSSESGVCA